MIARFLILLSVLHFSFAAITVDYEGNHYDSTATSTSLYTDGAWNYDYSHKLSTNAGKCKQSDGTEFTCATTDKCGPRCWEHVSVSNNMCGGTLQTPINLVTGVADSSLKFPKLTTTDGGCGTWVQFADDHAFEVSFSDGDFACPNFNLEFEGVSYNLKQFHFHAPSEHAVGGGIADAELHMVHKSASGQLLVLGVRLSQEVSLGYDDDNDGTDRISGQGNKFLANFWNAADIGYQALLDSNPSSCNNGLFTKDCNPNYSAGNYETYGFQYSVTDAPKISPYADFLPASRNYYHYMGSLTTVPCTEGVKWIVFEEPIYVSFDDVWKLRHAVSSESHTITLSSFEYADNRNLKPLGDRVVRKFVDVETVEADTVFVKDWTALGVAIAGLVVGVGAIIGLLVYILVKPKGAAINPKYEQQQNQQGSSAASTA